jgi:hypothetical protein
MVLLTIPVLSAGLFQEGLTHFIRIASEAQPTASSLLLLALLHFKLQDTT